MNIDKIIDIVRNHRLDEMMTVGGGAIAGTVEAGDDPPINIRKKKPPILARGKMPGLRTRWRTGQV